jgi:hypothetical protein
VLVRETIATFIESEGHRVDVSVLEESNELAELVFRTRGQMFSIATSEMDPLRFSISTAYEVPEWVRTPTSETLAEIESEYPGTRFTLAHDGTIFVATYDEEGVSAEALTQKLWHVIGRLREAGNTAIERMVDRSESKAAADKFIQEFMRGER